MLIKRLKSVIIISAAVFINYLQATLGCVPALLVLPTGLSTWLLRGHISVLTMHVGFLCGLRFTKKRCCFIILSATVF